MKLFLGHLLGFAFMTTFCFIVLSGLALFIPLLGAFLAWSLDPITFDFSATMFVVRGLLVLSAFVGVMFTTSKDGQAFAMEFAESK